MEKYLSSPNLGSFYLTGEGNGVGNMKFPPPRWNTLDTSGFWLILSLEFWKSKIFPNEFISRDSRNRTNYTEASYIPFELKFRLPKLRKWRIIAERDELGRIIHSYPPS